ncbi:MAG: phasin family protein [Alphaproteobacteria bacterium]|jgi:phasin family protein|nr:phasin family protein [Alphaproteobacteria bacterium]
MTIKTAKTAKTETAKTYDDVVSASKEGVEKFVATGKENVEKVVKLGTEAAEKVMSYNRQRVDAAVKAYDELTGFNKQTVEAVVSAGNVTVKGIESLNAEVMAFAKHQIEDSIAATKAVFGAKTLQEVLEVQQDFAKAAFDAYMAETTKLGELTAKFAQDAFAPINAQVQAAVERAVKPLAA